MRSDGGPFCWFQVFLNSTRNSQTLFILLYGVYCILHVVHIRSFLREGTSFLPIQTRKLFILKVDPLNFKWMKRGKGGKIAFIVSISSDTLCSIFRRGAKSLDSPLQSYVSQALKNSSLVPFCFWADWVIRGILKMSAILLKYPIFEVVFFHLFMGEKKLQN